MKNKILISGVLIILSRLKLSIRDKMSNRLEQIVLRKDGNEISIEKYLNSDRIMADLDKNVTFFCYGIWR